MSISWLWGSSSIKFYSAENTIAIPYKKSSEEQKDTPRNLASLCESATPPCNLNPLLFNGHLQTIWTVVKNQDVPIHYRRKLFESTDPTYAGQFSVDFVSHTPVEDADVNLHPRTSYFTDAEWKSLPSADSTPMLVALHGLSGGSHELYLRHVLYPLVNPAEGRQRWEACVINARGCANTAITSSVLFNARATWDVRQLVRWLRKTFPNRPLFAVGFSLGANILTNYLGEEGERCEIKAAVVLSNPWNLEAGSLQLQRTWLGLEVYSKSMGTNMKKLFEKHIDQIKQNPGIDIEGVRKSRYLHEFDRAVQCSTWGYPTEGAYYRDASSTEPLLAVRIPLFAIHAEDDPVAGAEALPYQEIKQNPYTVLCTTALGGHLSWFESGGSRWFVKPTENFFRKMAEEVDFDALHAAKRSLVGNGPAAGKNPVPFNPMGRKLPIPV